MRAGEELYGALVAGLWIAWLAYWIVSARNVKAVRRHETTASRLTYMVPQLIGAALMILPHVGTYWFFARFLPRTLTTYWIGVALLAAGLLTCVWARRYLGGNWSGAITIKEGHELIRTGPYRWVRHPIYSGLLLALLGTTILLGEWRALVGFGFLAISIVLKSRLEEHLLGEIFGEDYGRYRADVPALIPYVY